VFVVKVGIEPTSFETIGFESIAFTNFAT